MFRLRPKFVSAALLLAVLLAMTGCANRQKRIEASNEEKSTATRVLMDCVQRQTGFLDDGISDASVVASAVIKGPCHIEAQAVVVAYTRGSNARVRQMFSDNFFAKTGPEMATEIVLRQRARIARSLAPGV
jgi:hypothetical protein